MTDDGQRVDTTLVVNNENSASLTPVNVRYRRSKAPSGCLAARKAGLLSSTVVEFSYTQGILAPATVASANKEVSVPKKLSKYMR